MKADARAWLIVFAGTAAWSLDLLVSYAAIGKVHGSGDKTLLHIFTLVAEAIALGGIVVAWRARGRSETEAKRFVADLGVWLNAFMALAILAMAVPKILLRAGD